MKHGEFRQKMAVAKAIYQFQGSNKEAGENFGILPVVAATKRRFYQRHCQDPQCPWMDSVSHHGVIRASAIVPLDSIQSARHALIARFRYTAEGPYAPWPKGVPKRHVRVACEKAGLRWFNHNERPYVHWSEKAEAV